MSLLLAFLGGMLAFGWLLHGFNRWRWVRRLTLALSLGWFAGGCATLPPVLPSAALVPPHTIELMAGCVAGGKVASQVWTITCPGLVQAYTPCPIGRAVLLSTTPALWRCE